MHVNIEDFKTGWYGMAITLSTEDIDQLIANLQEIKEDKGKHFHFFSEYEGNGGVGDIAFYHNTDDFKSNMQTDKLKSSKDV